MKHQSNRAPGHQAVNDFHCSETLFTMEDINSMKLTCRALGLRGSSPLEAASYENETKEKWWEDPHTETER